MFATKRQKGRGNERVWLVGSCSILCYLFICFICKKCV